MVMDDEKEERMNEGSGRQGASYYYFLGWGELLMCFQFRFALVA